MYNVKYIQTAEWVENTLKKGKTELFLQTVCSTSSELLKSEGVHKGLEIVHLKHFAECYREHRSELARVEVIRSMRQINVKFSQNLLNKTWNKDQAIIIYYII